LNRVLPEPLVCGPNTGRNVIELGAGRLDAPVGAQREGIAGVPGEHVHVNVGDVLECGFAVGEEEVNAFAAEAGVTQRFRRSLRHGPEVPSGYLIHLVQVREVLFGDDHRVARGHRSNRQQAEHDIVLVERAGRTPAGYNLAICMDQTSSRSGPVCVPRLSAS